MRYIFFLMFTFACSTNPPTNKKQVALSNSSFKKVTPLRPNEFQDYYSEKIQTLNPALYDESIHRYSNKEMTQLSSSSDPLLKVSFLCTQNKFSDAFSVSSSLFDKYQNLPAYWNQLGSCYLRSGSYRKALLYYNKALELSPDYVPALNNIGVMYYNKKEYQKALVAFERATKKSKFSKTPRYNLSQLYLIYGLPELALPLLVDLSRNFPKDLELLNGLATSYFMMSDYVKALKIYQQIPQNHWEEPGIGLNLTLTLIALKQVNQAQQVFNLVNQPSSDSFKKYYILVKNHLEGKVL